MTGAGGAARAAELATRSGEVALCLDFDGTLAPIVDDPVRARPLPEVPALLGSLAKRFAAVALISGRPASYLAEHAAAPGVRYLGMYGLQEIRDGRLWVDPRLTAGRDAVVAARAELAESSPCARAGCTWRTSSTRGTGSPGDHQDFSNPMITCGSGPLPVATRRPPHLPVAQGDSIPSGARNILLGSLGPVLELRRRRRTEARSTMGLRHPGGQVARRTLLVENSTTARADHTTVAHRPVVGG